MYDPTTDTWRRQLKDRDFRPCAVAAIPFDPTLPTATSAVEHDRRLLEAHFGQAVTSLSEWHFNGRRFRLADGSAGVLAVR